jgi:hypothetical protein
MVSFLATTSAAAGTGIQPARSAAHRCLAISEVFECIISDWLGPGRWSSRHLERKDLLHLALTCRAFATPALDELWGDLNRLEYLVKYTMPDDVWAYKEIPDTTLYSPATGTRKVLVSTSPGCH